MVTTDANNAAARADAEDPAKPQSPTELTRQSWWYVVRKTAHEFTTDQCTDLAAALTYYAVLSLFPALLALVSLLGVFGQGQQTVDAVLQIVEDLGPSTAVDTLRGPVTQLVAAPAAGLALVTGLLGALWSASGYVGAFGRAMNRMYEVEEGRPFWKLRPIVLAVTLVGLTLVAIAAAMLALSGPVARAVGDVVGLGDTALTVWNIARFPIVLAIVVVVVAILYYATPNVSQPKFRWISIGALVAIVTWLIASILFGLYVAGFSNYNKTYGSLAGVIVFLLWLWITNLALLFGAELDSELERGRELQAGMPAEEDLQLPLRDTRGVDKTAEKEREHVEQARALRMSRGSTDDSDDRTESGNPTPRGGSMTNADPAQLGHTDPNTLTTVQLIERLAAQMSTLVRTEIRQALDEVKAKGSRLGVGLGISGAGTVLLLYGVAALIATAALGLATVLAPWLAVLIVGVVVLLIGALLVAIGAARAKRAVPPIPERTAASARADVDAVKEALR